MNFLKITQDICTEYWQESLQKNNISIFVISIIILIAELYNMVRVLFFSASGLGTLNNRIYFTMYFLLFIVAVLWHLLRRRIQRAAQRVQWLVQYSIIFLIVIWNVVLNAYDLTRDPRGGTTVFTTAVLSLGIFVQMSGIYSSFLFLFGYGLFCILAGSILDSGAMINLTITTAVALSVSLTGSHHAVVRLKQQKEIREMNARLKELARQDSLTGLLNKSTFQQRAEQCLKQIRERGSVTLFMFDHDDFKAINDNLGHPCGDYVLRETALKLKTVFSEAGEIGRIGGDEFAVVLSGADEAQAERMGERVLPEISSIRWQDTLVGAALSIGICYCNQQGISYEQLYREADLALYDAKNAGKGRCCVRRIKSTETGE